MIGPSSKRPINSQDEVAPRGEQAINPFRARHLALGRRPIPGSSGSHALVDEAESPLAWLASRKGRDGRPLIEPVQFLAGERLRADFTCGQLMPQVTTNWSAPVTDGRRSASPGTLTEAAIAARQRVHHALDAVGPEFAGLLVDVCCFLKRLIDVERERNWPPRSAKVVLQLGLDRLARHYGLSAQIRGRGNGKLRTWLADDAEFVVAHTNADSGE